MIKFLIPLFLVSTIFSSDTESYDFVDKADAAQIERAQFPKTVAQAAAAIEQIESDHYAVARAVRKSQTVTEVDQEIVHSPLRARRLSLPKVPAMQSIKAGADPLSQSPSIVITKYYPDSDVASNAPSELRQRCPELERALIVRPDDKKLQQQATCLTVLRNLFCS
ncbi:hypothetical protein A3F66_03955 [candidate division TM6 bacterium RIFCSPHIGHO2_12_FULL_32_22]|nr:MAG: hypothetical protein A3F66_03955 [candidate division TM6 bacterium RIFCSPHIGHO2_12_FULL_32_22]